MKKEVYVCVQIIFLFQMKYHQYFFTFSIPGVQNFESLKQTSKKNKFEYGLSMEFATQQLYDAYSSHPDHVQFIQQYWLNYVEDFLEIDYELLK